MVVNAPSPLVSKKKMPPRPLGDSNVLAPLGAPATRKTAAAAATSEGIAVVTVSTLSCRGCSAHLVDGDACELLRAGSASFHCAVKELSSSFRVLKHEGGDARKVDRLTCASCDRPLGISMKLDGITPRLLLKAKDLVVADNNGGSVVLEKWSELAEAKAALGDEESRKAVEAVKALSRESRPEKSAVVEKEEETPLDATKEVPVVNTEKESPLELEEDETSSVQAEATDDATAEEDVEISSADATEDSIVEEQDISDAVEEEKSLVGVDHLADGSLEKEEPSSGEEPVDEVDVAVLENKPQAPPLAQLNSGATRRSESNDPNERGPMPITRPWWTAFSGCSLCGVF